MSESRARVLVYARSSRDGFRVCEGRLERCGGQGTEWHHRKNRSQGGLWDPSNGLDLCNRCHEAVTNTRGRRTEFERMGLIVPGWAEPAVVPALIHTVHYGHAYVLLDNDGCYSLAPWPEHPEGHPDDLPVRGVR